MITIKQTGSFKNTERLLQRGTKIQVRSILDRYAKAGVIALANATPKDSAVTASSWEYVIETNKWGSSISWYNTNVVSGIPIAILIQYGHGTGTGGYVQPTDYINPAMRGIFDQMSEAVRKEVSNL